MRSAICPPGISADARASSAPRSWDLAAVELRAASSSEAHASSARSSTTASRAASAARMLASPWPCRNASQTTSVSSHACATISSAPAVPRATDEKMNARVARA